MGSIYQINRRKFIQYSSLSLGSSIFTACTNNSGQAPSNSDSSASPPATASSKRDKVTYGTNWFAQAEHGGFYQAIAKGIYKDYGLDVTIKMGGPQVNGTQLLMGGAVDFFMGHGRNAIGSCLPNPKGKLQSTNSPNVCCSISNYTTGRYYLRFVNASV